MKKLLLVLVLFSLVFLTSCSHIEDTNGPDDYSLCTMTDDNIINGYYSNISFGTVKTSSSTNNGVSGKYSVSKLSGVETIDNYKSKKDSITFEIDLTCEAGNVLFAIVSNDVIVKKVEANESVTFTVDNNGSYYKLVLLGESAKVSLKYEIKGSN